MREASQHDIGGYYHRDYAASLSEFGSPRFLGGSRAWVLERPVPGLPYRDASACYPLFCCYDWSKLSGDIDALPPDLLSLSMVTDPFGCFDPDALGKCFDRFLPFKVHYVADLTKPLETFVSKHHRYYARKALARMQVEVTDTPAAYVSEWTGLYGNLAKRHHLSSISTFSRQAFAAQLAVPGMIMMRAIHEGETSGAHLWALHDGVVHSHLTAFSDRGYGLMASYALHWAALEYFRGKVAWLNLGGPAGLNPGRQDGLAQFKRGWASDTRNVYFCGRILNKNGYGEAIARRGVRGSNFFPEYRDPSIRPETLELATARCSR